MNTQTPVTYHVRDTPLGALLIGCTPQGICFSAFVEQTEALAIAELQAHIPNASLIQSTAEHEPLLSLEKTPLDLYGTPFQQRVWNTLCTIPDGSVTTYREIAARINAPRAWRAVGTAIGKNPIALFIPCHRVLPASGGIGNYRWGTTRKQALLDWEKNRPLGDIFLKT